MADETQKRMGRPRVDADERMVPVTTWLPESVAQRVDNLSLRRGEKTSHVIRQCVLLQLPKIDKP